MNSKACIVAVGHSARTGGRRSTPHDTLSILYWHNPVHDWLERPDISLALSLYLCVRACVCHDYSKDLSGALDAVVECCNRYKVLPRIHDIIVALVEEGNTELLQKG